MGFNAGWSGGRSGLRISGIVSVGSVLTASGGTVLNWQRGDHFGQAGDGSFSDIPLATANTYTVTAADIGFAIRARGAGPVYTDSLRFVIPAAAVDVWEPQLLTPGAVADWVGVKGTHMPLASGSATASATSMNGKPGVTFAGRLTGALDLSAYNKVRLGAGLTSAAGVNAVAIEFTAGIGTQAGGFALVASNGAATRQSFYASGATGFGGRRVDPDDLNTPQVLTGILVIDGSNASAVDAIQLDGVAQPTFVNANTATAGTFANANLNFGSREDDSLPFIGTFGLIFLLSGGAIDADLTNMNAYAANCNGL